MKKSILICLAVLICGTSFAKKCYPIKGIYKLESIEAQGKRVSDLPELTYRTSAGDKTLIVWVQPIQTQASTRNLSWRVESTPNPDDPFATKITKKDSETSVISWYNCCYKNFYDFPTGIWIDEVWKKVSNEDIVSHISDVTTHLTSKKKLEGSWTQVTMQAHDQLGDSILTVKGNYKIYGKEYCLMLRGSLYDIENGNRAFLRDFQWVSDNEFLEAGMKHKVTFISPTKMTVEYQNETNGRMSELWIRHDIPEPLASLLSNFK